jgi:lysophospholipase L1-like esterase
MDSHYTFLALGDSYTIGEAVAESERWPMQLKVLLNSKGLVLNEIDIIAKTGWTTDELIIAIDDSQHLKRNYNYVSLLVGVNNQYRGYPLDNYEKEFSQLLKTAIAYADNVSDNVIVLSIPDWGVMPFAEGRDRIKIAKEIDAFNTVNKSVAMQENVKYVDITPISRLASDDKSLTASDGLHPSGTMYKLWALEVAKLF